MVGGKKKVYTDCLKGEVYSLVLKLGERLKRHVLILWVSDRINSVENSLNIKQ